MYDSPPVFGNFSDVLPGDPWMPEPAARYNAVNELLRQEKNFADNSGPPPDNSCIISVCNVSEQSLPSGQAVQVDSEFAKEVYLSEREPYLFGKPVENEYSPWGVALETIPPGKSGPVQFSGIALLRSVKGAYYNISPNGDPMHRFAESRNDFVFAGRDGLFHPGHRGRAQILWYDYKRTKHAIVLLGAEDHYYSGMFAVLDNGNGTMTVKGGFSDLYEVTGYGMIQDTVIPIESDSPRYVHLTAEPDFIHWKLGIMQTGKPNGAYIPGERLCWDLARYWGKDSFGYARNLVQLWSGGIINFKERYYAG